MGKIGTKLLFSTTCHSQTDKQTEVVNKTSIQLLTSIIQKNLNQEDFPPFIGFAYNYSVHSSTNFSPFEIICSFNLLAPLDLIHLPIDESVCLDGNRKTHVVKDLTIKVQQHIQKKNEQYTYKTNK
jgi:hypothetical protein